MTDEKEHEKPKSRNVTEQKPGAGLLELFSGLVDKAQSAIKTAHKAKDVVASHAVAEIERFHMAVEDKAVASATGALKKGSEVLESRPGREVTRVAASAASKVLDKGGQLLDEHTELRDAALDAAATVAQQPETQKLRSETVQAALRAVLEASQHTDQVEAVLQEVLEELGSLGPRNRVQLGSLEESLARVLEKKPDVAQSVVDTTLAEPGGQHAVGAVMETTLRASAENPATAQVLQEQLGGVIDRALKQPEQRKIMAEMACKQSLGILRRFFERTKQATARLTEKIRGFVRSIADLFRGHNKAKREIIRKQEDAPEELVGALDDADAFDQLTGSD